jgi:ribonuclease HI
MPESHDARVAVATEWVTRRRDKSLKLKQQRDRNSASIELWTDGSCLGNPGPGGWAFVLVASRNGAVVRTLEDSGKVPETTNNRMELQAVTEGLRRLTRPTKVTVNSDSRYVVNPISQGWLDRWQRDGWRLRPQDGKRISDRPVKNADQWRDLIDAAAGHTVTWSHVAGHAGIEWNERCHQLAIAAAEGAKSALNHFNR